jgi:prepilin-type N-terminal cleavage/methylation domain-containing protein
MCRKRSSGFTLLELLITVVLVGILAAIAVPS